MKSHCFLCKHHRSWHETRIPGNLTEVECRSHGCNCKGFIDTPKEIENPNSRLRSVPHPYPDKAATKDELMAGSKVPMSEQYGRGPADVFMDEMEKINPNARVALSAGHKMIDSMPKAEQINPDQKSLRQRIAMKKDEDRLGNEHNWRELDEIATEARINIIDTVESPIAKDGIQNQIQQIVRRAMHEGRRPLLEQMSDRAFRDAHPPMVVGPCEARDVLADAMKDFKHIIECEQAGLDLEEPVFMAALGKLGRVHSSMSVQPTQREPEKPPEPLSKSKEPCPVCMSLTMKYWRNSSDRYLYECSTCHVVLAVPLSARRDISKAPPSGAGAVGEPEVTAR